MFSTISSSRRVISLFQRAFAYNTKGLLSPAAWHLVVPQNLDVSSIEGTGKGGRIMKYDVINFLANGGHSTTQKTVKPAKQPVKKTQQPIPQGKKGKYEDVSLSDVIRQQASVYENSKNLVPHLRVEKQCNVDSFLEFQKSVNQSNSINLSLGSFLVKVIDTCIKEQNNDFEPFISSPLCISYIQDTQNGTQTIPIKNTNKKTLLDIYKEIHSNILTGASIGSPNSLFAVYSLEQYSILDVTGIVEQPSQLGLFTVGGITQTVGYKPEIKDPQAAEESRDNSVISATQKVVNMEGDLEEETEKLNYVPCTKNTVSIALNYNARQVPEPVASRLLAAVAHYIEHPYLVLSL
ncbi:hypothetical protein WA158_003660 [Blastocystis sp. Blastoise]